MVKEMKNYNMKAHRETRTVFFSVYHQEDL